MQVSVDAILPSSVICDVLMVNDAHCVDVEHGLLVGRGSLAWHQLVSS